MKPNLPRLYHRDTAPPQAEQRKETNTHPSAKPTSLFARASENAARAASRSPEPEGAGTNIASLGRFLGPAIDVGSTSTSCGETTTSPADGVGVEVEVEAEAESREEEKEVSKGDGTA